LLPPNLDTPVMDYQRVDFAIFHPKMSEKIIVEIDGEQHKSQIFYDRQRDEVLRKYGYTVIRIPVDEIRKRRGRNLDELNSRLNENRIEIKSKKSDKDLKFLYSLKIAHQIQLVLLQAIWSGYLDLEDEKNWCIISDLDEIGLFNEEESLEILKKSIEDFIELLIKLCKLYSLNINKLKFESNLFSLHNSDKYDQTIFISFSDKFTTELPTFYVQNIYFPFHITNSSFSATPVIGGLERPDEEDLEYFLRYIFRKPNFWEGQYEGITRALQGKDALLLLPTGAGKSLVFQLASLLLPGSTVVIDPIISLMEDQIDNLARIGIDRCIAITSQIENTQDRIRAIQLFGQGEYLFAYVAPERFQTVEFRESLRTLTTHTPIALIVVDEAHCVSEWGHDFRTAYLNIGRTSREYCKSNNYIPPLIALTGTASRAVLKDVQRELQIEDFDAIITPKTFDRKELKFEIIFSNSREKLARLKGYLAQKLPNLFKMSSTTFYQPQGKNTYSGLIFCPHVNGEFGVENVAGEIKKSLGISVSVYSGKEPKKWESRDYLMHKKSVMRKYKWNKIPLLVCTKAFGMGIDKPNIRYTVHFGLPPSIESFYQEAGRAGRDRNTAYCCIIVSNDDAERSRNLLNPNTKVEEIDNVLKKIPWEANDDITRVLYFHTNSFRGIESEKKDVAEILRQIGDVSKRGLITLTIPEKIKQSFKYSGQAREVTEKALHRLLIIGVVSDYTIDYSKEEFSVKLSGAGREEIIEAYGKYVESYLYSRRQNEIYKASRLLYTSFNEFILGMIDLLLHFIYDVIERGRRRALLEMLLACTASSNDKDFRERILRYLEATAYFEDLEKVITDRDAGIEKCKDLFSSVRSPNEAAELRGQVSRYLESYPDHPSLLMLRSLAEVYSRNRNNDVAKQNFIASISSALSNYGINETIVFDFAGWAILNISKRDKVLAKELVFELNKEYQNRLLARTLIEKLPITLTEIPAWYLLKILNESCKSLINK
jgi:ATP-dependent DNA helicase RecQ